VKSAFLVLLALALPACGNSSNGSQHSGKDAGGDAGAVCPASGVSKRPWVLHVDGSSAVVRWEACRDGTDGKLTLTPEKGQGSKQFDSTSKAFEIKETYTAPLNPAAPPDAAGTYWTHEVKLDGLSPATCYSYVLSADKSDTGRFCTARAPGDPFTFMAIADTNPGLGEHLKNVEKVIDGEPYDFTIHGGDVQYYASGLETWAYWFPAMSPILSHGAFLPCIGNHEMEKPDEYQEYYSRFFGGAGFDGTDGWYRFESGGVWFFSMDTEADVVAGSTQFDWFKKELADAAGQPGYRFSVVFLHRPLLTCGDTSQKDTERAALTPLFEQYGVRLVLQGHMHGYEHFEVPETSDPSKTITYLTVAGGGGAIGDPSKNISRPTCSMRTAVGSYRFAEIIKVDDTSLSGRTIDETGKVRDTFSQPLP
jgi:hypothetical protein